MRLSDTIAGSIARMPRDPEEEPRPSGQRRGRPSDGQRRSGGSRDGSGGRGGSSSAGRGDRDGRPGSRGKDRYGGNRDGRGRPGRDNDRYGARNDTRARPGGRGRFEDEGDRTPRRRPPGAVGKSGSNEPQVTAKGRKFKESDSRAKDYGPDRPPKPESDAPWEAENWTDDGPVRKAATDAVKRGRGRSSGQRRAKHALDVDQKTVRRRLGQLQGDRAVSRLGEAVDAFADSRFEDARKLLKPLSEALPDESSIRELHGLCLYRLGKWSGAVNELTAFADSQQSTEQHPVLADCQRALGRHRAVEELWRELAEASPAKHLVAEGRIVYAGSLADQGKLAEAIELLEAAPLGTSRLEEHHLRLRYTLADLYDRAGEVQAARRLFRSIQKAEPGFVDVPERLAAL